MYYCKVYWFVRNNTQICDAEKAKLQCEPSWNPCHRGNALGATMDGQVHQHFSGLSVCLSVGVSVCLFVCLTIFRLFFVS